jgi:hypothetical protein
LFKKLSLVATLSLMMFTSANAAFVTFLFDQQFLVPNGVNALNILAVGGGGGGANGHQGGGGSGSVKVGTFIVNPGDLFSVEVGLGGSGASDSIGNNNIVDISPGGDSWFGDLLTAPGGGVVTVANQNNQNGGSGGGAACNSGTRGGNGGSGGGNGSPCQNGSSNPHGEGQGDYTLLLALFVDNVITAGVGGSGGTGSHAGGGGAGGIFINALGLSAQDGSQSFSGKGGNGYGAGGGAGGWITGIPTRWAGGDGANGLVYVEYDIISAVPLPAAAWLFGTALIGLIGFSRRRKAA